jgi:pentatricopeptide repeat protein
MDSIIIDSLCKDKFIINARNLYSKMIARRISPMVRHLAAKIVKVFIG